MTHNQVVPGSSPGGTTKNPSRRRVFLFILNRNLSSYNCRILNFPSNTNSFLTNTKTPPTQAKHHTTLEVNKI